MPDIRDMHNRRPRNEPQPQKGGFWIGRVLCTVIGTLFTLAVLIALSPLFVMGLLLITTFLMGFLLASRITIQIYVPSDYIEEEGFDTESDDEDYLVPRSRK